MHTPLQYYYNADNKVFNLQAIIRSETVTLYGMSQKWYLDNDCGFDKILSGLNYYRYKKEAQKICRKL